MNTNLNKRFWEIDSLRGVAIVMMVTFHFIFDLYYFGIYSLDVHSGFLWLGFTPYNFYTLDYFPLLPWLGVMSLGIFLGNTLYENYTRHFKLPDLSKYAIIKASGFLGRHSLLIYFIHQPVLIIILLIVTPANIKSGLLIF